MIVLEGSPGAGKTTLLGQLLAALPERLVVFPEAQPPEGVDDEARVIRALLAQDAGRVTAARTVAATVPDAVMVSDRCYLGVLAYRYALARIGRTAWAPFHHARAVGQERQLRARTLPRRDHQPASHAQYLEIDTPDQATVGHWQFLAAQNHVPNNVRVVP